ncbi:MAG: LytR/AlgR family response regulator transcription factor [Bacteroidales bacterium]
MNAYIVDDNPNDRQVLKRLLAKYHNDLSIVGEAEGVNQAYDYLAFNTPDVVFLDIQLQDGLGFDLLLKLKTIKFKVIFTTSHDEYAIRAIKFSALDYLLKPLDQDQLDTVIAKLLKESEDLLYFKKIEELLSNINEFSKIALPSANSIRFIPIENIIRCEADCNYTWFFLKSGEKILVSRSLKEYDELLEPLHFFRVHQSHLINLKYVAAFNKSDGGVLVMDDHAEIIVARRRKDQLLALLMK